MKKKIKTNDVVEFEFNDSGRLIGIVNHIINNRYYVYSAGKIFELCDYHIFDIF